MPRWRAGRRAAGSRQPAHSGAGWRAQRGQRAPGSRQLRVTSASQPAHSRAPRTRAPHSGQSQPMADASRDHSCRPARRGNRGRRPGCAQCLPSRHQSCSARPFRRGRDRNVPSRIRPLPTLPIVSADVPRQFARRGDPSEAQFLYGEVARRMLGRLQYIRLAPQAMLDAGCGAGDNLPLLRALSGRGLHRPDNCEPLLAAARSATRRAGWARGSAAGASRTGRARLRQRRPGADRPGAGIAGTGLVQPGSCTGTARRTRRWPGGAC